MHPARFYTKAGGDLYEGVRFRTVSTEDWIEYIVPQHWNQAAADVLREKVFYPQALPALTRRVAEPDVPSWLWKSEVDSAGLDHISAEWRYLYEKDIRDVLHRISGALTYQAWKNGLFDKEEAAKTFYDEYRYILLHQKAAPELKQWQSLGLDWAYGLNNIATYKPQYNIISFETETSQALRRIKIRGETLALSQEPPKVSVTLPVENIDSASFVSWKRNSDIRRVTENLGAHAFATAIYHVMDACDRESFFGFDPERNPLLRQAMTEAKHAGLSDAALRLAINYAEQGYEEINFSVPEEEKTAEECIKTFLSVPDDFIEAALTGHMFVFDDDTHKPADKLWDSLAEAIWSSGEPVVSFRSSIEAGNPLSGNGRPLVCDTGGAFVFLPDSAAPAATIHLQPSGAEKTIVDVAALQHVTKIMTLALEAALQISSASPVTKEYRPVLLGMTNIAAVLMGRGTAYDSDTGRTIAALLAGLISGVAHQTSAEIAVKQGSFPAYAGIAKTYLQHIKDKMVALAGTAFLQKGMTRRPVQIRTTLCPDAVLAETVKQVWENVYRLGKETGFRHAHLTGIDTDLSVQALLGAQTQDIMPESSLVRFEGYFSDTLETAQLYGKNLNPMLPRALTALGYGADARDAIHFYAVGHGTLLDAPHINHKSLREKGFHQAALDAVEQALGTSLHIRYVFNKWTLGEEFCQRILGFSAEDLERGTFDILSALGFSEDHIEAANIYCCGTMTLEGAPHLKPDHMSVFDCIAPVGSFSVRRVSPLAQIKMQAAVEPFLSGAVAHTVMLGHTVTIDEVQKLVLAGWELGVKNLRLYRDGCSLLHPFVLPQSSEEAERDVEETRITAPQRMKVAS